jgi:hypothetical protein
MYFCSDDDGLGEKVHSHPTSPLPSPGRSSLPHTTSTSIEKNPVYISTGVLNKKEDVNSEPSSGLQRRIDKYAEIIQRYSNSYGLESYYGVSDGGEGDNASHSLVRHGLNISTEDVDEGVISNLYPFTGVSRLHSSAIMSPSVPLETYLRETEAHCKKQRKRMNKYCDDWEIESMFFF